MSQELLPHTGIDGDVRRERVQAKLSQKVLAERADLNVRTIQKIEAGDINILVTILAKLQVAIGCSWGALLGQEAKRRGA